MTNKFEEKLKTILKKESRFLDQEGDLLTNTIIDNAYKADSKLIELMISDKEMKDKFFSKIKDVYVFNINDFVSYIQDKNFLNDSYTKFKNKIGLNIGGKFLNERKEISLVWPFKDCVLEGGMTKEDEKRKEVFFNEILAQDDIDKLLAPKVLNNWKRYTKNGEEKVKELKRDKVGVIRENLIIKGNNLLALHSLKEQFSGQVKLIYIDPPYNPDSAANTFAYNNNFNHSTWLTFMKNRLDTAKSLLTDDGFLCVAIDHYELFYLGAYCDELFGRDNRVGIIAVETNPGGRSDSEFFATSHEYFIVYAKNRQNSKINDISMTLEELANYNLADSISKYKLVPLRRTGSNSTPDKRPNLCFPIYVNPKDLSISLDKIKGYIEILPEGADNIMRVWRWSKGKIESSLNDIEVKVTKEKYSIFVKDRIKFGKKPKTFWYGSKYDASSHGTKLLQSIDVEGNFSYPKSLFLMEDIIQVLSDNNSIILDYHAGSGTTAHAVLELNKKDKERGNRKFILVEQMDYIETVTISRIQKLIKNEKLNADFVYFELMKYNENFIENIEKAKDFKTLLKVWKEIKENAFFNYNIDLKVFEENLKEFEKLPLNKQKEILVSILNKNQLYVNLSDIEDREFKVEKEDQELNKKFYK